MKEESLDKTPKQQKKPADDRSQNRFSALEDNDEPKISSIEEGDENEEDLDEAIQNPNSVMKISMKDTEQMPDDDCRDLFKRKISSYIQDYYQANDSEKIIKILMELNLRKLTSLISNNGEMRDFLKAYKFSPREISELSPKRSNDAPLMPSKEYTYLIEVTQKNSNLDISEAVIEFTKMVFKTASEISPAHNTVMNPVNRIDISMPLYDSEQVQKTKDDLNGTYITAIDRSVKSQMKGTIRITTTLDLVYFLGSPSRRRLGDGQLLSDFLKSKNLWVNILDQETTDKVPSCVCIRSSKYDDRWKAASEIVSALSLFCKIDLEDDQIELRWERYKAPSEARNSAMILHIYIDTEMEIRVREALLSEINELDTDQKTVDLFPTTYDFEFAAFGEVDMKKGVTPISIIKKQMEFTKETSSVFVTGLNNRDLSKIPPLPENKGKWTDDCSL